jgi:hypothetical protein
LPALDDPKSIYGTLRMKTALYTIHRKVSNLLAFNHFKNFFKDTSAPNLAAQIELASLFPKMVTTEEAIALEAPCTKEELLVVLKGFKKEKSPGPDGGQLNYIYIFLILCFRISWTSWRMLEPEEW